MRAFPDESETFDEESYTNGGEASGSGSKDGSAPEGQIFDQW